ncbi:flagellar protein FlgN [Fictibacillus sp. FJAT-27399]|uniref:flagellar protein FlgN n=1 Tax=Fictibacillus sp. FJAT-27399 TaxID=1729689 RepID=UPI0007846C18|nr:flagellar protein FlgN [Fictibacillus sp. FJAT-27399]
MALKDMKSLLNKLLDVHRELNSIAEQKTTILKTGDVKALDALMLKENEHVKTLMELEEMRNGTSALTMSELIEQAVPSEKEQLEALQYELSKEYMLLKERNELNQQLIHQSLQFVNMSLNMFMPEPEKVTYSRPQAKEYAGAGSFSLFDSKA